MYAFIKNNDFFFEHSLLYYIILIKRNGPSKVSASLAFSPSDGFCGFLARSDNRVFRIDETPYTVVCVWKILKNFVYFFISFFFLILLTFL